MFIRIASWGLSWVFVVLMSSAVTLQAVAAGPEVVATWQGGLQFLPASASRSGEFSDISFVGEEPEGWGQRVANEYLKPGTKVPAVIHLHGCSGQGSTHAWATIYTKLGFAFFAPDSFMRPGRQIRCYSQSDRSGMRLEEMKYTLSQLRRLPWIDQSRLVLSGFSEGGESVGAYNGDDFMALVVLGADCGWSGGSPYVSPHTPVLNIVGGDDHFDSEGCSISSDEKGSRNVTILGAGHQFHNEPAAAGAIATFLATCCGVKINSLSAGLDVETEARRLIAEIGSLATMEANMKAEEALASGDGEGEKFWKAVSDLALKIVAP
ncbi:MAG: hypothetical protein HQ513_06275 [Rhodospirillales bacterium]|nr:hypothetical protein [Rhodospirillales bacterium]